MEQMKVVARFKDGSVLKGFTGNLIPTRDFFNLIPHNAPSQDTLVVHFKDLKAVFIVKDFAGHPEHKEKNEFQPGKPTPGRKIQVTFKDGEQLIGTTQGYTPGRPSFYLVPADAESNIERCLVITSATKEVKFI